MQSTLAPAVPATPADASSAVVVCPDFLLAAFAQVPDPRRRQGTRYSLATILTLVLVAILSHCTSVLAIAQFGADAAAEVRQDMGFPQGTPCQSTVQRLLAKLDPDGLIAALRGAGAALVPVPTTRGSQGIALDGKAHRGRLAADPAAGVVHVLSAFCQDVGIVLAQAPIECAADKAEGELTVAPEVVAALDWHNRVLTGDALFCQRKLAQQIVEAGGDYLLAVKENQPTLFADIRLLFEPPDPSVALTDRREATTVDVGHGRHADARHLIASTDLVGYLDWPGHAQVFRWERTWTQKGKAHHAVRYGITSLPPAVADADRLLALKRAHWQIENRLHRPKDTALDEDASLVHRGHGPDILSAFRNLAISLLHAAGITAIAAHLRHFSSHPEEALRLVTHFSPQNA